MVWGFESPPAHQTVSFNFKLRVQIMAVTVETLEKLQRRITLSLPADVLKNEVDARLKKLARTVKADGFRPGKVPMNVVTQRYGYSVHYEVMNDKLAKHSLKPQLKLKCVLLVLLASAKSKASLLTVKFNSTPLSKSTQTSPSVTCLPSKSNVSTPKWTTLPSTALLKSCASNVVRSLNVQPPKPLLTVIA